MGAGILIDSAIITFALCQKSGHNNKTSYSLLKLVT